MSLCKWFVTCHRTEPWSFRIVATTKQCQCSRLKFSLAPLWEHQILENKICIINGSRNLKCWVLSQLIFQSTVSCRQMIEFCLLSKNHWRDQVTEVDSQDEAVGRGWPTSRSIFVSISDICICIPPCCCSSFHQESLALYLYCSLTMLLILPARTQGKLICSECVKFRKLGRPLILVSDPDDKHSWATRMTRWHCIYCKAHLNSNIKL